MLTETFEQDFNLEEYIGTWYEIARLPTWYQLRCERSVAHYTKCDGKYKIKNECFLGDKCTNTVEGCIEQPDECVPAALLVSFGGYPKSDYPNYIVHKTDYKTYAIVGSFNRTSLFILSRSPTMDKALFAEICVFCKGIGYPTEKLIFDGLPPSFFGSIGQIPYIFCSFLEGFPLENLCNRIWTKFF